ncbi:MAG: desulfoferrodoxin [Nanoarchaeota archaeon]
MTKKGEIYKCEICGNIVEVLHEGSGGLVCCGQPMKPQEENTVDATLEKHVPIIEENSEGVIIKVGSVEHPMTEEHYIEWIEIITENGTGKKYLKPGEKPEVKFPVKTKILFARAYCNLHGLWVSTFLKQKT